MDTYKPGAVAYRELAHAIKNKQIKIEAMCHSHRTLKAEHIFIAHDNQPEIQIWFGCTPCKTSINTGWDKYYYGPIGPQKLLVTGMSRKR